MVTQSLKDRETECLLLWHLKPSCPWIQQVSSSSAQGLVIHCWGRTLLKQEGLGPRGLVGARGWWMGLGVNAKTINPTSTWPQVPIKFIYIFTLHPPLKHLCLDIWKQHDVPIWYVLPADSDRELGSVYLSLIWLTVDWSSHSKMTQRTFYQLQVCIGSFYLYYPVAALTAFLSNWEYTWRHLELLTFFILCLTSFPNVICRLLYYCQSELV